MKMSATPDVIVIGGGHNGLVAANYLARAKADVLVLEAHTALGGMSGSDYLIPEAPNHLINYCAVDIIFIKAVGILDDLELAEHGYRDIEVDPGTVYLDADGASLAFWRSPARTAEEIRKFSAEDADAYVKLLRTLDAAVDIGLPFMATNPMRPNPRALAKVAGGLARYRREIGDLISMMVSPAAQVVDERFRHPIVRNAIAAQAAAVSPIGTDGSGLSLMLLPFYHRFGNFRPLGGTQSLPNALASALHANGGSFRTGAVVEEILISGGRAVGVRLDTGEEIKANKGVLSTGDPRTTLGSLVPTGTLDRVSEARVTHIPAYREKYAHLKIDVALSGRVTLDRHDKWRGDGLDLRKPAALTGTFDETLASYPKAQAGMIPASPSLWMVIPTAADPDQAPKGQDTVYLWAQAMPLDPLEPWSTLGARAAEQVVKSAGELYNGISEMEIGRLVETPEDLARRFRMRNGCIYHTDFTVLRAGPLRPAVGLSGFRTPVPGLFLGGAGSHPAPAVTGLPGRLAAREVLRRRNK